MISPGQLLGLPKFDEGWYPGQEAIWQQMMAWASSDERILGASVPTGFGKSLLAMLLSHFSGLRTVYLTSTKGLQGQLMADFNRLGMVDIRGQNEYQCIQFNGIQVDSAPCKAGYQCSVKAECSYYSQLGKAQSAKMVVTNYAYWLAQSEYGSGFSGSVPVVHKHPGGWKEVELEANPPQLLILDEAHMASKALESFLSVEFTEFDRSDINWQQKWDYDKWLAEGSRALPGIKQEIDDIYNMMQRDMDNRRDLVRRHRYLQGLSNKIERLGQAMNWVQQVDEDKTTWTPLWVADYSHMLIRGVPKVMLMSAILTPKSMQTLGLKGQWLEADSPFPIRNTPITHVKTVKVDFRASDAQMQDWVDRIDEIISQRQHQKGIIFTVSYARTKFLHERSRFANQMYTHHQRNVSQVVDRFKKAAAPAVLISPSVTTGYDFPGEQCEYVVVGKIPYPDTRQAIIKARVKEDKDWTGALAMETLVQETGRGTRSAEDTCQVLVIDDSWLWWWPKYKSFAPKWFQQRVTRTVDRIPTPI